MSTLTTTLIPEYCGRGHEMRYDEVRGRKVCDRCEGIGKRPATSARAAAKGSNRSKVAMTKPALSLVQTIQPHEDITAKEGTTSTLPPSQGARIQTRAIKPRAEAYSEDEIQNASITTLRAHGYLVHVNSVRLKAKLVRCSDCGNSWWQQPEYNTGQTPGIPDLAATSLGWRHPLLPASLWLGLEQKGSTTQLSEDQKRLEQDGFTVVSRSREANMEATKSVDDFFEYVALLEEVRKICESEIALPADIVSRLTRFKAPIPRRNGRPLKVVKLPPDRSNK